MPGRIYRIFDTAIRCDFPLPELPLANGQDHSISISLEEGDPGRFGQRGLKRSFEWKNPDGEIVCRCERDAESYLFTFPESATFHITVNGGIQCYLYRDASLQLLRHLLLNQVIPRYLATTGRLVLHAGAITLESGQSVAFLGNSGFGKSTLVSSFHRNGAQLINDDCVMLECGEGGVTAIGGLTGIRLFPDSVDAVFHESTGFTDFTPYTDKQQLLLKEQLDSSLCESRVLDAMFLLNDPEEPSESIRIEPVSGSEAMIAMIYSAFSLDPSDRKTIMENFQRTGEAIGEHLRIFSLRYPRVHDRLPDVRAAVSGHMSQLA